MKNLACSHCSQESADKDFLHIFFLFCFGKSQARISPCPENCEGGLFYFTYRILEKDHSEARLCGHGRQNRGDGLFAMAFHPN